MTVFVSICSMLFSGAGLQVSSYIFIKLFVQFISERGKTLAFLCMTTH